MNNRYKALAVLALVAVTFAARARAEDVPSWFVPEDKCQAKPCTCDDIPMMELHLQNQKNALEAWKTVQSDILTQTGPATPAAATKLFGSRFSGDTRLVTQFESCPDFDANKNTANKIAGVTGFGDAVLDPCFCATSCKAIVSSTVAHEKMHVPTIIAGVVSKGDYLVACGLGLLSGRVCEVLMPTALADSEVLSYGAGITWLEASLDALKAKDPAMPAMACTWMPLAPQQAALTPAPKGFFARVALLLRRIVNGATPPKDSTALASLDASKR